MADKGSKKKTGLTLACIILAVLVIFIIFLVKKDSIITNLKETRFFERVFGSTPEFVENHVTEEKNTVEIPVEQDTVVINVEPKTTSPSQDKTEAPAKKDEGTAVKENTKEETKTEAKETKETKPVQNAYTDLQLCFVEIHADGSINRKIIKRSVPKNDSPLATSIKLLLEGPDTTRSDEKDCTSLVPSGVRLLGARVTDGVAYLDFNDNFEINTYGVEGYTCQLMQIVYTATAFSTVNSVQFLIEGKKKEYLGSEGQWIGSPLSRTSFN
ncbi:MAG: GerMN domain-containing protein [Treponema sp.]|nr:GerMN domain-containing protein [Treponema sp.]